MSSPQPTTKTESALDPFRRAIVRGLGILLPPLLTIVILAVGFARTSAPKAAPAH